MGLAEIGQVKPPVFLGSGKKTTFVKGDELAGSPEIGFAWPWCLEKNKNILSQMVVKHGDLLWYKVKEHTQKNKSKIRQIGSTLQKDWGESNIMLFDSLKKQRNHKSLVHKQIENSKHTVWTT